MGSDEFGEDYDRLRSFELGLRLAVFIDENWYDFASMRW